MPVARAVKVGAFLPLAETQMAGQTPHWSDVQAMACAAEDVGLDSIWVCDHLRFEFPGIKASSYECVTTLAALAAVTERVEIGSLVICTGFRNPAVLASMVNTIEEISDGRVILGLGAGYHEPEYRAFGIPNDHRASRFEEALHVIATLLRERYVDFEGKYYSARDCALEISGPRPKGPPIMIGTMGERMLRLTAQHAEQWNGWLVWGNSSATEIPPLREKVDAACREVGRDPATLERTASVIVDFINRPDTPPAPDRSWNPTPIVGSPAEIAAQLRAFADEGISHLQIWTNPRTVKGIELLGPVLEALDRG
jgi:alkanesulfonate monooxygenase SsuD/methylene tetrahydromethanopterin reductase-like flavin-dependent oxidoreductase (luciferase family)